MTTVSAERANEALRLTYGLLHACREKTDLRLWSALIALAPPGVVLRAANQLRKDQRIEREEMRRAVRMAVRKSDHQEHSSRD
jgi:hypothetical protein